MNEVPPDVEYHREKAHAVSQRSYRRLHGRNALRMLETAYAEDVGKLCDRIEQLEGALEPWAEALIGWIKRAGEEDPEEKGGRA